MAYAGIPYLESGESLILTTDRVYVNAVQYDILLTSRTLILVDVRYAQFPPQMIPLLTVQSVKAGKTANGEPVITLFFADPDGSSATESTVLLFSQHPGEQRKRERDEWLKTLMGLIVSVRQETRYEIIPEGDKETGIRPSTRHSIAPEIPLPYTKVVEKRPAQIELIISPDEPESPVFSEELPEMPILKEKSASEVTPSPSSIDETPGVLLELTESWSITPSPQGAMTESASINKEIPAFQDTITPVRVVEGVPDAARAGAESIDTELPSLPVFDDTTIASHDDTESFHPPLHPEVPAIPDSALINDEESASKMTQILIQRCEEIPVTPEVGAGVQKTVTISFLAAVKSLRSPPVKTGLQDTSLTPFPDFEETPVTLPEVKVSPETLSSPAVQKIVASSFLQEAKAEASLPQKTSVTDEKSVDSQEESLSLNLPPASAPVTIENSGIPVKNSSHTGLVLPEEEIGDEPAQQLTPETTPVTSQSPPPSPGPGSRGKMFIAVAAIILIILGIAGLIVFYQQNITAPLAEPSPITTSAVQLTLQPTLSTAPQQTPVTLPATGVWVRVDYPRNYYGWVGNAGSMRGVAGSGDQIYKIPDIDRFVQVQMFKPDTSADPLTVEIYRDGEVISSRSVSAPKSSIELLIDAKTGNPPGITPVVTHSGNQTGSNTGRIMYF